jgi:hypothetical protein
MSLTITTTPVNPPKAAFNKSSKDLLAKLLATENIRVVHSASVKTASFDVKKRVLTLPVWQGISEDLVDMLTVHEVGHALDTPMDEWMAARKEIAKTVLGSSSDYSMKIAHGYTNVIEDVRVDKRQKRRYPGSIRNYQIAYKELYARDFFNLKKKPLETLSFIDRANMYYKGGTLMGLKFSVEERALLDRMSQTETFQDVVALTIDVMTFCKAEQAKQNEQQFENDLKFGEEESSEEYEASDDEITEGFDSDEQDDYEDGDAADEGDEADDDGYDLTKDNEGEKDGDDGQEANDEANAKGESEGDNDGDPSDEEGQDGKGKGAGEGDEEVDQDVDDGSDAGKPGQKYGSDERGGPGGGPGGSPGFDPVMGQLPEATTDQAWEENQQTFANGDTNYVYLTLPTPKLATIQDDYKKVLAEWDRECDGFSSDWMATNTANFTAWKMAEEKTISFLVKEFEMRKAADMYARTSSAKTGQIDTNKLYSYKYNDDIFRRLSVEPSGKNHGLVLLLDWSGSMQPNLGYTLRQLFSVVMFCKRVQIPFEVYLFRNVRNPSYYKTENNESTDCWEYKEGDIQMEDVRLRNILSSRMKNSEMIKACSHLWAMVQGRFYYCEPMSGTPLVEAVVALNPIVQKFRKDNRVQICNMVFFTDGDGYTTGRYVTGKTETGQPVTSQMVRSSDYSKINNCYVIQDPVSRREYPLPKYFGQREMYSIFLEMLKTDTDSNLSGFFLSTNNFKEVAGKFLGGMAVNEFITKKQKLWSDEGFIEVSNIGYDAYYVINLRKVKSAKDIELNVNSEMTRSKIFNTFRKFSERKAVNRVLLQSFTKLLAGQFKKVKKG